MSALTILMPYEGDFFSGSHISSLVMARGLADRGHRVIIASHGQGRILDEAGKVGLETLLLPRLYSEEVARKAASARLGHFLHIPRLAKSLRALNPDIVHPNDLAMLRAWSLPARLNGKTLIAHWRSNYRKSVTVDFGLKLADAIISVSHYSRDRLPEFAREKTTVEYNALPRVWNEDERQDAYAAIRQRLGLPANAVLIGVFGTFTERKRTFMLADILNAIPEAADGRPVYGVACGDYTEPRDTQLEPKIAAFGLKERLLMPGFVRPVEEWMAACDVVLAPAEREPLARNVLEARAVGSPTISSADGGLKEKIDDGVDGFLLSPFDLDAWIEKVRLLINDKSLAGAFSARAREKSVELTPDRHAERIEAIYRSVFRG